MKKLSLVLMLVLTSVGFLLAQRTITGQVLDTEGQALIGATVLVKGTSIGTVTDIDGQYTINVPSGSNTLVFSYTGYAAEEVEIGVSDVINVTLEQTTAELMEVVVTGYGEQSRRRLTSSISSVESKAFENVSVQSFERALQGRLPGVNITGNSGTLGSQQVIRVRGVGSINASNQPLFVIDGLILNNDQESGFALGGPGTNPMINLNANEIESIDVLKDAAAAAIYGSRGSNGVILITTKSGAYNQEPDVNLNYYTGWSEPTEQYDMLSGPQYAELWNRAAIAAGLTQADNPEYFYDVASQPTADWLDLVSHKGWVYESSANVSGGTQTTKYYVGGTYRNEEGWIKTTRLQRYSIRANIEQQIGDEWEVGMQISPSRTVNDRQNEDNNVASPQTYGALFFPNVDPFDENGSVRGGIVRTSIGQSQFAGTPLANLVGQEISTTTTQILSNFYAEYRPIPQLRIRSALGSQFLQIEDLLKQGSQTTDGFGVDGSGDGINTQVLNWTWRSLATYTDQIGDHSFDATLGFEMQREQTSSIDVTGNTFADDRLLTLNSAAEITGGGGFKTESNFVGIIGRVNYAFRNKYLLTGSARVDGSSRFGTNKRYGVFPAVSAGWIISDEPWIESGLINFLKLRGGWGLTGNASIGNFDARGLVSFGRDYNMIPGFFFTQLENADLEWEKGETIDFGIEFGLLNNRLRGSVGYFFRNTKDLLLNVPLPQTIGIEEASITQNAGEIQNKGLEFQVDYDIFDGPFRWTLGVNGATLDNKVKRLVDNNGDGVDDDITGNETIIRVGEPVRSFYLVRYAGVDPGNGDALFLDANGETIVNRTPSSARVIAGNPLPDFSGGINTEFAFKGFDLSAFFQFATGHQIFRSEGRFVETNLGSVFNQRLNMLDAWTPENPDTDIPEARLFTSNGNQRSTRYLSDADFIRLKNVQLGYTTPPLGNTQTRIRVFLAGQNLWTATNFTGLDPEAGGNDADSEVSGVLFFSRPQSKTYTIGVNLNF
jgi:TonB-linked SusC/RagA family outer membrane protein